MSSEEPVELTIVARQAGVRIALVRRYLQFGLLEPHPEPAETPRYHPRSAARVAQAERITRKIAKSRHEYSARARGTRLISRLAYACPANHAENARTRTLRARHGRRGVSFDGLDDRMRRECPAAADARAGS